MWCKLSSDEVSRRSKKNVKSMVVKLVAPLTKCEVEVKDGKVVTSLKTIKKDSVLSLMENLSLN